jgi:uncharacterized protein YcbX
MPTVCRIQIHPLKALDPVTVAEAKVLPSGALEFDRRWAFVDTRGQFVNGKNRAEVHQIRAQYDLPRLEVTLNERVYSLERQRTEIGTWMSERLNERVELRENREMGFPDDTFSSGPTFVAQASLDLVANWFALSQMETRVRFRTNVEFDGVEAFWEDRLYGLIFRVGNVQVDAVNPCQRCIVPSRQPLTGEAMVGFQKHFAQLRKATLASTTDSSRFDHYYRFAVNTRIPSFQGGKAIRIGDSIVFPVAPLRPPGDCGAP